MPTLDLGALTIPIFTAIFGAGWTSCYAILVRPMQERMTALEGKLDTIEKANHEELQELRKRLGMR